MRRLAWWIAAAALGVAGIVGCPDFAPDSICGYPGYCDGGAGGDGNNIDAPPGCDPTADPSDAGACVVDDFGVFVDHMGSDSNPGTKEMPVATIAKGLALAGATTGKRIYVCAGTYAEDVTLDSTHDGISIYGGWTCGTWAYSGTQPQIGKSKLAMTITGLTKKVSIEDVYVKAADGVAPGDTSMAVLVANSMAGVTFNRVKLQAGKGAAGANGTLSSYTLPAQTALNGNTATGPDGGAAQSVTCPGGDTTTGGKGGDNGFPGDDGTPNLGAGKGGSNSSCGSGGTGTNGNSGAAGNDGPAITTVGTLTMTGWTPNNGAAGAHGNCGQGGGGGYGSGAGGGGSGGAGGCGGAGGGGGGGGGASIAVAVVASVVAVNASILTSDAAGNGAGGVVGQAGQNFSGFGGAPGNGKFPGCTGGGGGTGGNGGAGGGGAGGVSVGVLWKSMQPVVDAPTMGMITVGMKGTKGAGGNGNDGVDGVAQPVFQSP